MRRLFVLAALAVCTALASPVLAASMHIDPGRSQEKTASAAPATHGDAVTAFADIAPVALKTAPSSVGDRPADGSPTEGSLFYAVVIIVALPSPDGSALGSSTHTT